ncbi:hypothetical protein AMTR_s00029p00239110 [Amborella trichopoda]|uniref:arginyltransferase n=2 Tax=Amborella trichopoda TaxID=13333 RepID=W1PPY9_AMBTC|nr:hypothetical protein AMTR_s00029p00239110 [Amborella trichopoda]
MAVRTECEASSSTGNRGESVVVDRGWLRGSCGYCKSNSRSSLAHGMGARSITVDDYQELLDRGWRRSGSFIYKPEMEKTCCPLYTIRLKVDDFVPSKEQIRVSRRMQRYLDGTLGLKKSDKSQNEEQDSSQGSCSLTCHMSTSQGSQNLVQKVSFSSSDCKEVNEAPMETKDLSAQIDNALKACIETDELAALMDLPSACVKRVNPQTKRKLRELSGNLLYTSNIAFQFAAALRRLQSADKKSQELEEVKDGVNAGEKPKILSPREIAEKVAYSLNQQGGIADISIEACNGHLNFFSLTKEKRSDELPVKGTRAKTNSSLNKNKSPPFKKRRLEIRMKRSCFDPEEYALYRRYQIKVHNEKPEQVKESSYRRFLVDTPLVFVPHSNDRTVPPCGFGSFHQQYVIDGKLVAVGVVDILPRCLSSKYLFWDPDLAFLSLGKYSALQEINWVKEAQRHCPSLQYYYLGYYIHSCPKMRYKAAYCPSELLCPLRYGWVPFHIAKPLLDKKPYVVLSDYKTLAAEDPKSSTEPQQCEQPSAEDQSEVLHDDDDDDDDNDEGEEMDLDMDEWDTGPDDDSESNNMSLPDELLNVDVDKIMIALNGSRVRFKDFKEDSPIERRHIAVLELQLQRYAKAVGRTASEHMVYSLG